MNLYLQIFSCFAKVGAFTLGGGYAMISVIEQEVVRKRSWVNEEEFLDAVTIAQSSPGLLAVNISIFLGYKLKGTKGSIVATLGSITPPFFIILAIAMFFAQFQDYPAVIRIFKGIRPVVVSLIAVPVITMARKAKLGKWRLAIAAATAILIVFVDVSPVYIMMAAFIWFIFNIELRRTHINDFISRHSRKNKRGEKGGEQ